MLEGTELAGLGESHAGCYPLAASNGASNAFTKAERPRPERASLHQGTRQHPTAGR
jgi:hypothetical protein